MKKILIIGMILDFSINDFSQNPDNLIKSYFLNSQNLKLDFSNEYAVLEKLSILLREKAKSLDVTLIPTIEASTKAISNNMDKIKNKLIQSLKRREEQKVNQINKLSKLVHENGKLKKGLKVSYLVFSKVLMIIFINLKKSF